MNNKQLQNENEISLPCTSREQFDAPQCEPCILNDEEKTIFSAIVMQKGEAEAAEIFRESPEHLRDYTILKGVNSYAALGCRYEDEHPGMFIGSDYVQYPAAEQKPSMEMQVM